MKFRDYLNRISNYNENSMDKNTINSEFIKRDLDLRKNKKIKSLGKLKKVEGSVLSSTELLDLGNLEYVGRDLFFPDDSKIKSLGKLKRVERDIFCSPSIQNLGDLEYVGRDLNLIACDNLKTLGKIKHIGGTIFMNKNSKITKEYVKEKYNMLLRNCIWVEDNL